MESMSIGESIRKIRKAKNIKSKDLAKKLNIAPSTLSSYENNKNLVSLAMLDKIAQVLNVPIESIINNVSETNSLNSETIKDFFEQLVQCDSSKSAELLIELNNIYLRHQ